MSDFQQYINWPKLPEDSPVFVAASGGVDSMVLLHLCAGRFKDVTALHCNFKLRGEESDADQTFVEQQSVELGVKIMVKTFDLDDQHPNIQLEARTLRYNWFEEVCGSDGVLLTAHHLDDSIETFFLNLLRGSGLAGLSGIPAEREYIQRPLIHLKRSQIETYAADNGVKFREDSSNKTDAYDRNYIRHHVIPSLEELRPEFRHTMARSMAHLQEANQLMSELKEQEWLKRAVKTELGWTVGIESLDDSAKYLLSAKLRELGFSVGQTQDIWSVQQPGKQFISTDFVLTTDRDSWLISKIGIQEYESWEQVIDSLDAPQPIVTGSLQFNTLEANTWGGDLEPDNENVGFFDADKFEGAIKVRNWREGDVFVPLGMTGKKKLSDLFIDEKIALPAKERIPLLLCDTDIVWVIGIRVDNRFKVDDETRRVLRVEYKPENDQN